MYLISFMKDVLAKEEQLKNFKITEAFFRLLTKMFKQATPLDYLSPAQLLELDNSLIFTSIQEVYMPCMLNFFSIQYANSESAASFFARVFKLTRTML